MPALRRGRRAPARRGGMRPRGARGRVGASRWSRFDGRPRGRDRAWRAQTPAHSLVEECMIAANEAVARYLIARGTPDGLPPPRGPGPAQHRACSTSSWRRSAWPRRRCPTARSAPERGARAVRRGGRGRRAPPRPAGSGGRRAALALVLRALRQAHYSATEVGHSGLASPAYLHFTSPIRRYPDLLVHRGLLDALGLGDPGPRGRRARRGGRAQLRHRARGRRRRAPRRRHLRRLPAARRLTAPRLGRARSRAGHRPHRRGPLRRLRARPSRASCPSRRLEDDHYRADPLGVQPDRRRHRAAHPPGRPDRGAGGARRAPARARRAGAGAEAPARRPRPRGSRRGRRGGPARRANIAAPMATKKKTRRRSASGTSPRTAAPSTSTRSPTARGRHRAAGQRGQGPPRARRHDHATPTSQIRNGEAWLVGAAHRRLRERRLRRPRPAPHAQAAAAPQGDRADRARRSPRRASPLVPLRLYFKERARQDRAGPRARQDASTTSGARSPSATPSARPTAR